MAAFNIGTETVTTAGDVIETVAPIAKNTSTTLVFAVDRSITVDSTAGNVTHVLPNPQLQVGAIFEMKRINAAGNIVRYQADVGHTIDGAAFFDLVEVNDAVKIISDGTVTWRVISIVTTPVLPPLTVGASFAVSTNTAALGFKKIYACTDTTAARTLTISSADIALGSPATPWEIVVKDESGGAAAFNITIDTEGAETIDGVASVAITADFGSAILYSNGSNLFSK